MNIYLFYLVSISSVYIACLESPYYDVKEGNDMGSVSLSGDYIEEYEAKALENLLIGTTKIIREALGSIAFYIRVTGDTLAGVLGGVLKSLGTLCGLVGLGLREISFSFSRPRAPEENMPSLHNLIIRRIGVFLSALSDIFHGFGETVKLAGEASEILSTSLGQAAEDSFRALQSITVTLENGAKYLLNSHLRKEFSNNLRKLGGGYTTANIDKKLISRSDSSQKHVILEGLHLKYGDDYVSTIQTNELNITDQYSIPLRFMTNTYSYKTLQTENETCLSRTPFDDIQTCFDPVLENSNNHHIPQPVVVPPGLVPSITTSDVLNQDIQWTFSWSRLFSFWLFGPFHRTVDVAPLYAHILLCLLLVAAVTSASRGHKNQALLVLFVVLCCSLYLATIDFSHRTRIEKISRIDSVQSYLREVVVNSTKLTESDFEVSIWVNTVLLQLWNVGSTGGLGPYLSETIMTAINDQIALFPPTVANLKIKVFALGTQAPLVKAIRMRPRRPPICVAPDVMRTHSTQNQKTSSSSNGGPFRDSSWASRGTSCLRMVLDMEIGIIFY